MKRELYPYLVAVELGVGTAPEVTGGHDLSVSGLILSFEVYTLQHFWLVVYELAEIFDSIE